MRHAIITICFCLHLYCLARWLRRLGAGLQERVLAGSATWRSVFCLRAPRARGGPPAGLGTDDVAAERMPRGRLSRRARTRPTEVRARSALSAPPHHLARKNQISWRRPYPFKRSGSQSSREFNSVTLCLQPALTL